VLQEVLLEKQAEMAAEFDAIHSVERARKVGSLDEIIEPDRLRDVLASVVSGDRNAGAETVEVRAVGEGAEEWGTGTRLPSVRRSLNGLNGCACNVFRIASFVIGVYCTPVGFRQVIRAIRILTPPLIVLFLDWEAGFSKTRLVAVEMKTTQTCQPACIRAIMVAWCIC
jgi:hypothetical protein